MSIFTEGVGLNDIIEPEDDDADIDARGELASPFTACKMVIKTKNGVS